MMGLIGQEYANRVNITRIYLMLGNACNFKCTYCLQRVMACQKVVPHEPNEETYNYIEHLIKVRPDHKEKLILLFWGGEPLLYMDIIRKVVSRFGDKLEYCIITNGDLITEELVDYFNGRNINVKISHDGINTACTRGKNILDDPNKCKLISKINRLTVESVTSKYNYDYAGLFEYLKNKLGREVPVTIDRLAVTWDMPKDIYDVPLDDYNEKLRWLAGKALDDIINMKQTQEVGVFYPYLEAILNNNITTCPAFYRDIDIDCDGNIHYCHNTDDILGSCSDNRMMLAPKFEEWRDAHLNEECKTCFAYNLCDGGCPLSYEHIHKVCDMYKVFYTVCYDLADAIFNSFEPIDWEVE